MPSRDRLPIRRESAQPAPRPAAASSERRPADPRSWEPVTADPPRPAPRRPDHGAPETGSASTWAASTVMTRALLPLRIFFGATFLYAGIDKIINPLFLRASGPGSIGEQLAGFERVSPIAGIVHLADPIPVLVGLLIALLEIAVGLGALLGLLFRWAALAGAMLSFLFFLTASWATHPYYYGADLPYMFGWITLALAGHGHLFTVEDWLADRQAGAGAAASTWSPRGGGSVRRSSATPPMFTDQERRAFLQLGILAVASIAVASLTGLWGLRERAEGGGEANIPTGSGGGVSPSAGASASAGPSASAGASASPAASGASSQNVIGTLADLKSQGQLTFQDPGTGDPGIVVDAGGKVVAFDALCTHQGCQVEYDPSQTLLVCPCHGAEFDPTKGAAVVAGPAPTPLASFPITVDSASGKIYLKA